MSSDERLDRPGIARQHFLFRQFDRITQTLDLRKNPLVAPRVLFSIAPPIWRRVRLGATSIFFGRRAHQLLPLLCSGADRTFRRGTAKVGPAKVV